MQRGIFAAAARDFGHEKTLNSFIDVARQSGVGHIVFVSVAGADRNAWVPHHAVERHLQTGPKDWTILRPGFLSQNVIDAYRRDIVEDDRLYVPSADGYVAFIDARDVADVAATALLDPGANHGRAISLPGAESLTFGEVAELLTDALGRPIRYEPASILGYMAHLAKRRLPIMQILVQTLLHVSLRQGRSAPPDTTLAALLDRDPRTMREFISDHRQLLLRGPLKG